MNIELLEEVAAEIGEYNAVTAGLADLKRKYGNVVVDVSSPSALAFAKTARHEIREPRHACEKIRKALKAPALLRAKLIDSEAARITAELLAIEAPWDEAIKAEEARKEVAKAALEQAEREQSEKIQARIDALGLNVGLVNASPDVILIELSRISQTEVSLEIFGSRAGEAAQIKAATQDQLDQLFRAAEVRKLQQAALDLQQAQLAAAQKKLDDDQAAAVAARMAEDLRLAGLRAEEERRIADERAKLDSDLATARKAEQDKLDAEAKLVRDAADAAQKVLDDAAAAARKKADDLAAAERLRLFELAAIERAEFERAVAEKQAEAARIEANSSRVRGAATALLTGLQWALDQISEEPYEWQTEEQTDAHLAAIAAVKQATGE